MAMVVVDDICLQADSQPKSGVTWSEGRRPLGAALHSPDEPSELSHSVIFILIYFLILVLVAVFEIFFTFSFVLVFIIFFVLVLVFQLFLSYSLVSVLHYFCVSVFVFHFIMLK